MKREIFLALLTMIFGATIALPTLAAEPTSDQVMTSKQYVRSQLSYEVINAVNGVVVNINSSNPNWVNKLHEKYDSLPKTSKKYFDNQIEVDLLKTTTGIQAIITVLRPSGSNYQSLVQKVQAKFASGQHAGYSILKIRYFLKNHLGWAL